IPRYTAMQTSLGSNGACLMLKTLSLYRNASLYCNTISLYRRAKPPIIAILQYNIAIPQDKTSNYRNTAIQYRYTAKLLSLYRRAKPPIIAMPQYNKKTYINMDRNQLNTVNISISIAIPQYGYFETNPCK